jgi:hypothetical protein
MAILVQFGQLRYQVPDNTHILNLWRNNGKIYPRSGLKFIEVIANGVKYKLIQQNPKKASNWGNLAQQGHEVVQVVNATGKYMGVFVDGVYNKY